MSNHFKRLCSVVNQISTNLNFSVSQFFQNFEFSKNFERHNFSKSSQSDFQSQKNSQQNIDDDAKKFILNIFFIDRDASKKFKKKFAEKQ